MTILSTKEHNKYEKSSPKTGELLMFIGTYQAIVKSLSRPKDIEIDAPTLSERVQTKW